jgi:hypothetical protein
MSAPTLAPGISEADFQAAVIDVAKRYQWHVSHTSPAQVRAGRWATPATAGVPDLLLVRGGCVILAELKAEKGRVSPTQASWLAALGSYGRLWRPSMFPEIVDELRSAA